MDHHSISVNRHLLQWRRYSENEVFASGGNFEHRRRRLQVSHTFTKSNFPLGEISQIEKGKKEISLLGDNQSEMRCDYVLHLPLRTFATAC